MIIGCGHTNALRTCVIIAVITVVSGFAIQTRLVGHSALYRMVLTH